MQLRVYLMLYILTLDHLFYEARVNRNVGSLQVLVIPA
jgi:hypothetical protein